MEFGFISGHVVLDFVGTVRHRRSDALDLIVTPEDLARWVAVAGLVDRPPGPDTGGFGEALQLREAMHRLALAASGGADYPATDRRLMNRVAARPPVGVRLDADGSVRRIGTVDAALADLARAAVELFGGPGARMIKECSAPDCTRLYVDNSRRGARRWCDMAQCGNRAKAAGFRARHTPA